MDTTKLPHASDALTKGTKYLSENPSTVFLNEKWYFKDLNKVMSGTANIKIDTIPDNNIQLEYMLPNEIIIKTNLKDNWVPNNAIGVIFKKQNNAIINIPNSLMVYIA
jgi:hypothetical protein